MKILPKVLFTACRKGKIDGFDSLDDPLPDPIEVQHVFNAMKDDRFYSLTPKVI